MEPMVVTTAHDCLLTMEPEGRMLPLSSSSLLHVGHYDSMWRALRATTTCNLNAQAVLPLHHVHLPDTTALSGLKGR